MQDELEFRRNAESAIAALKQALIRAEDQAEFEAEEQNGVLKVVFDEPPAKFVITPKSLRASHFSTPPTAIIYLHR